MTQKCKLPAMDKLMDLTKNLLNMKMEFQMLVNCDLHKYSLRGLVQLFHIIYTQKHGK